MCSKDIWRMIKRSEKAVDDLERLVKMGLSSHERLEAERKRLSKLYEMVW